MGLMKHFSTEYPERKNIVGIKRVRVDGEEVILPIDKKEFDKKEAKDVFRKQADNH